MTGWPDQPVIYEINTAVWLNGLARAGGRRVTLAAWRTPTGMRSPRPASTPSG